MRKEPSLSSASATKMSPLPSSAPSPVPARMPPMTYDGSAPHSRSTVVSMEVLVVLPCVPATAIPRWPSMMEASAAARLGQLGIALPDRGGHHDGVRVAEIRRSVPDMHLRAERREPGEHVRAGRVAAGHGDPPGQHDPGDPGHARAADAGEVHPSQLAEADRIHRSHQAHGASPWHTCG